MKAVVENSSPVIFSKSLFTPAAGGLEGFPHNVDNFVDNVQSPTGACFSPVDESYAQRRCGYFSTFPGTQVPVPPPEGNGYGRTRVDIPPFFRTREQVPFPPLGKTCVYCGLSPRLSSTAAFRPDGQLCQRRVEGVSPFQSCPQTRAASDNCRVFLNQSALALRK